MRINQQNENTSGTGGKSTAVFKIRWKWLLGSFAVLIVFFGALAGLYKFQTKDQTEFHIKFFTEKEQAGLWRDGVQQLMRYQEKKPNDTQLVEVLAKAFDENGVMASDWNSAIRYLQMQLGKAETPEEKLRIRERILDNQRKLQDIENMTQSIAHILQQSPENPLAWKCLVIVRAPALQTGNYLPGKDEPPYFDLLTKKALGLNPDDVELVTVYARLLRSGFQTVLACTSPEFRDVPATVRANEADHLMEKFTQDHPDSVEALLTHYEYRLQYRLLDPDAEEIDEELKKVMDMDPNNLTAMMYVGIFQEQKVFRMKATMSEEDYRNKLAEAAAKFEDMIAKAPGSAMGYIQLASLYASDGQSDKQIETLEQGNKATRTDDLNVIISLILAYLEEGDTQNADRVIRQIHDWIERHRGDKTAPETIRSCTQIAAMLEGQSLAIAGDGVEAIKKFRSVFVPTIPRKIDIRLVYNSLMLYAQLLIDSVNVDAAIDVYQQTTRYLEMETQSGDLINFFRIDRAFAMEINALMQAGQTGRLNSTMLRFVEFLQKELRQQPDNQTARLSLAMILYQQMMLQPEEQRDWTEISRMLEILHPNKLRVMRPWDVDFLQADVSWEQLGHSSANIEEILIPLRLCENQFNDNLLFLVSLEAVYRKFNAVKDCDRVLEQIRTFPDGLPYWYLLKAVRAEQYGNVTEARRLINEAMEHLTDTQKEVFLSLQGPLASDDAAAGTGSIVRRRQDIEQLRKQNAEKPTIQSLFRQALMELDDGNTRAVADIESKLRKMEGDEGTLAVFLEAERLLQEATDASDPKIEMARSRQRLLVGKRPNWEYTYLLAADIGDKAGNESDVIDALGKAVEAGNRDMTRHRDLIELYRNNNRAVDAQNAYSQSVRIFPNIMSGPHVRFRPPYQSYYMDFLRAVRREDAAAARRIADQWVERAKAGNMEVNDLALVYSVIAQNMMGIDQPDVAKGFYEKAAETGGERVLPLAKFYADNGDMQKALAMIFEEMKKSETPENFLLSALGLMRDHEYEPAWAEPFDEFVLAFDPAGSDDVRELFQYVQYLMIRGMDDKVLPFYIRMYELDKGNVTTMNDLAYLLAFRETDDAAEKEADFRDAIALIDRAIDINAESAMLIDTKGLILMAQGHPDQAVPLFQKAVDLSRQGVIYRLHLAVALLRAGDRDQADAEFETIRAMLVPQIDLLPEKNRNYTQELLDAFPEETQ